ncbi:MAG: hypothetical protein HQM03_13005 [Magnetococcales bacterium]|nr:hypothetical protein [Magnetococcales bacterium]
MSSLSYISAFHQWGARVVPFLLAGLLGLQLAGLTWRLLPAPAPRADAAVALPERKAKPAAPVIAPDAAREGLRRFNPWENVQRVAEKPVPPPVQAAPPAPVASSLDLNLIGAMILPKLSWAVLTRKANPNVQIVLQVGEEVDGATLKKIERRAVLFDNRGRLERIEMVDPVGKPDPSPMTAQAAAPASRSANVRLLPRAEYDAMLAKGMELLTGVNLSPFYQGKDAAGYRVKFPDNKSELQKIGLASEDVIRQVNGIPVTDMPRITQLAAQLKTQSSVRIDLMRDNQPATIELQIEK